MPGGNIIYAGGFIGRNGGPTLRLRCSIPLIQAHTRVGVIVIVCMKEDNDTDSPYFPSRLHDGLVAHLTIPPRIPFELLLQTK